MGKLKTGKSSGKDELIKGGGYRVVDRIRRLCNMSFESIVPEGWRSAVFVPLHKGKGERNECSSYRGISLLRVVGKIYTRISVSEQGGV